MMGDGRNDGLGPPLKLMSWDSLVSVRSPLLCQSIAPPLVVGPSMRTNPGSSVDLGVPLQCLAAERETAPNTLSRKLGGPNHLVRYAGRAPEESVPRPS